MSKAITVNSEAVTGCAPMWSAPRDSYAPTVTRPVGEAVGVVAPLSGKALKALIRRQQVECRAYDRGCDVSQMAPPAPRLTSLDAYRTVTGPTADDRADLLLACGIATIYVDAWGN